MKEGRVCAKCGEYKLANEYWKMYGKLRSSCIPCTKKIDKSPFINCKDCGKRVKKKSPKHKYCRDCIKKRDLKSAHKWLESHKQEREFKDKKNIGNLTRYHIKMPKNQVCQVCNKNKAKEMHHPDYKKTLEVIFVCKSCHNEIHSGVKYRK